MIRTIPHDDPANPGNPKDCSSANFLKGVLSSNAGGSFDGVSYHAYDYYGGASGTYANLNWNTTYLDDGPSLVNKAAYIRNLLQANNVSGKYLLNTENALLCGTCSGDTDFEQTKANYLAESYAYAMAQNLSANVWFSLKGEWGKDNGLLDLNNGLVPLPAYYAYKFAAIELDGASYSGKSTSLQGVERIEFDLGSYRVWLMWVPGGGSVTVDLGAVPLNVYRVDGTPVGATSQQLVLTQEPYYVEMPLPRLYLPITNLRSYTSIPNGDFEEGQAGWLFLTTACRPV